MAGIIEAQTLHPTWTGRTKITCQNNLALYDLRKAEKKKKDNASKRVAQQHTLLTPNMTRRVRPSENATCKEMPGTGQGAHVRSTNSKVEPQKSSSCIPIGSQATQSTFNALHQGWTSNRSKSQTNVSHFPKHSTTLLRQKSSKSLTHRGPVTMLAQDMTDMKIRRMGATF